MADFFISLGTLGCVYVVGCTSSTDFPTTHGAYNESYNAHTDIFIAKLNELGNALIYSTYLGGRAADDWPSSMAVDSTGCVYVAGNTNWSDFPTTPGAYDRSFNDNYLVGDAFVVKLNASGSALVYSTFLGGYGVDCASSMAIDVNDCAYVSGTTCSLNFPITTGAFKSKIDDSSDIFVTKFNQSGSALLYSTILGRGKSYAISSLNHIAVDSFGCAYIAGESWAPEFPTTPGAHNIIHGDYDANFVAKLNASGNALVYSTFLDRGAGQNEITSVRAITLDTNGCAFVVGSTGFTDYPTTSDAFDTTMDGANDAFVTKLNQTGSAFLYSTFLGGNYEDQPYYYYVQDNAGAVAISSSNCLYVLGYTVCPDFPVTPGAYEITLTDWQSCFISKFNFIPRKPDLLIKTSAERYYSGDDIFNSDGTNQTKMQIAEINQKVVYSFSVVNAGEADDSFKITGPAGGNGWIVKYYTFAANADVTSQVTGSGLKTATLNPGASSEIYAIVEPGSVTPLGSVNTLLIKAASEIDKTKIDVVKAMTTCVASRKPDLLIKAGIERTYIGLDVINIDGTNQTKSQNGAPNQKITYTFKVKNAGNANDSFKITGPGSVAGWNVRYYESNTGAEVTSQVTGGGWSSGTIGPGATKGIFVNVKSDATLSLGATNTLLITASSDSDNTKIDVVKAVTTFTGIYKTDMLIKSGPETSYSGASTYCTDGTNQTKMQNVCAGQKVTYGFRARNGGNAIDSFKITGPAGGGGWSVKYYDFTTSADVTSQVTGAGWVSSILAPGTMGGVFVNIKPDSTVPIGSSITLTMTGTSMSDNTKIDVVKAVTICVASYKPDLLIKLGTESTYSGLDVINADGTDQTKTQNAAINQKVTCSFRVKNAGYLSDSFKITGPGGGSGWTVKYIDLASGADVTSQVTGNRMAEWNHGTRNRQRSVCKDHS